MYKPLFLLKSIHLNTANGICVFRITVLELEYLYVYYFTWLENKSHILKDLLPSQYQILFVDLATQVGLSF